MEKIHHEIFNSFNPEREKIKLYNPKYLDKGGDHLVYEIEGHPDIVIKASTFKIKDILSENPNGQIEPHLENKISEEILQKNSKNRNLKKYFGEKAVLSEKRYLTKVTISPMIMEEIFSCDWKHRTLPEGYQETKEVWTVATIQKKSEIITSPTAISFNFGGFMEENNIELGSLDVLNQTLLSGAGLEHSESDLFFKNVNIVGKSNLKNINDLITSDESFKNVFEDLILKIIKYTNETGDIMALAGVNNLVFSKNSESGLWEYNLIDVLPVHTEKMFEVSKKVIGKYLIGEHIDELERTILVKTLNYVRVINFFAKSLGLKEVLNILPHEGHDNLKKLTNLVSKAKHF